ncbi:hypothetical protein [Aquiflexum sp.]|uniref:hypothetical protein n=1 Tax=Aquiflexum sp. TaxID=1872584 RepID=UPI00359390B3
MQIKTICILFSISFFFIIEETVGQENTAEGFTTFYMHIKPRGYQNKEIIGFELYNRGRRNKQEWNSPRLEPLLKDSLGYLVKVELPNELIPEVKMLRCRAIARNPQKNLGPEFLEFTYGGVNLSSIRLNISSDPSGAEVFLVPNRVWQSRIEKQNWKEDPDLLTDFRVNSSLTETFVFIDQTVFKVIFKLGEQFQILTHFTKPPSIEQEQTVSAQFKQ